MNVKWQARRQARCPIARSLLSCPAVAICILPALVEVGLARAPRSEEAACQTSDYPGPCANNADDIAWMQVSLLQTAQHVRPASDASSVEKPGHDSAAKTEVSVYMDVDLSTVDGSWLAGIIMTVIGQTICVIGLQMQKISHLTHTPNASLKNKPLDDGLSKTAGAPYGSLVDEEGYYFFHWRWLIGAIVWALGHIMCWVALGLAPQSILSCLQSWNIVVALALAPVMLKETLPPHAVEYATLLVIGCIVVVMFGPQPDHYELETVSGLEQAFVAPGALVVHFICIGLLVASLSTSLLQDNALWRTERFVLMSATCAWYAALFSKAMSMLVVASVAGDQSQMANVGFYVFAALFGLFAVAQVHFMNLGLKFGLASAVMPMYEAISMVGQLFFGGILFGEFHNFRGNDVRGFVPGVVVVLIGLGLLIRSNQDDYDDASKDSPPAEPN